MKHSNKHSVCGCHRQQPATTAMTQPSKAATRQSPTNVDQPCAGDDEDCGGSSGAEEPATIIIEQPSTASTSTAVVPRQQVASTRTLDNGPSPTRPPPPTRRGDRDGRLPPGPLSAAPPFPDAVTPGQRYSSLDGQNQRSSNNPSFAAVSMNIILIVGIAAAFVVLLLILIFAVCAYSRQRPAGVSGRPRPKTTSGKVDNKGYTYEACNTSPPMPIATAPVVLNACNYQPIPGAGGPYSTMSMTFQPMSPDAVDAKPPGKKDVKEWYV